MNTWLQEIYPLFVCLWLAAHFITNNRGSKRGRKCHSTKTALDDAIPFVPGMAIFYFSGFILANMAYFFFGPTKYFSCIAIGYGVQFVISLFLYTVYPCRVNRCENFTPDSISSYSLAVFQRISQPFNAFPSMHASYCLFSALAVWNYGSSHATGLVMIAWAVLVALSTLLTKQHHIVDVLAGATLGAGSYVLAM